MKNVTFSLYDIEEIKKRFDEDDNETLEYVKKSNEYYSNIKPVRKGYYLTGLNTNHSVEEIDKKRSYQNPLYIRAEKGKPAKSARSWDGKDFYRKNDMGQYGVADTLNQIYKYGQLYEKKYPSSDFVCLITPIVKAHQPESGGWRYHKWGQYIGNRELRFEYLYHDETAPKEVYVFHFYELKRKV